MRTVTRFKSVVLATVLFTLLAVLSAIAGQLLYDKLVVRESSLAYWPLAVQPPPPAHRI